MASRLRRAYAVLELSRPVTERELKRQYRRLVKRWHPDRYTLDPVGQAEAAQRMREINNAYQVLSADFHGLSEDETASLEPPHADFFLSRGDVDNIVASINDANTWTLWPKLSLHRGLSLCVVLGYVTVAATLVLPPANVDAMIHRVFGRALVYFWLPIYLIWFAEAENTSRHGRALFLMIGWVLMLAPAVVGVVWWMSS